MTSGPAADARPGDVELDRLAVLAVDAVLDELPPPDPSEDRTLRRVRTVVDAIRAVGER